MISFKKYLSITLLILLLLGNHALASSYIINQGSTGTATGTNIYYGTGNYTSGLASSNFIANYTQIAQDIITGKSKNSTSSSSSSDGSGNDFVTPGFFTVTPSIKCTTRGCTTNYFDVCFKDTWGVSAPAGNTIFDPKITVSNTIIVSCIGMRSKATISAFGECKTLNGISRACARFSPPCKNDNNYCCPGNSCNSNDSSCPGCKQESNYRICAYYDPIDVNDWNLGSMPFHKNSSVPPEVTGGTNLVALGALVIAAGLLVPGLGEATVAIGLGIMLAGGIMELITFVSSTINYIVIKNVGCIDVPLAPSPPPFFSYIVPTLPNASITNICQYSPEYALSSELQSALTSSGLTQAQISRLNNIQASTANSLCEVGGTAAAPQYSTFENPAVRIYFSNPLPLCSGGTSITNDICVQGQALDTPDNLQATNLSLIPICSSSITSNCIKFPSGRSVGGPFRAYFNVQASSGMKISGNTPSTTPYIITNPSLQTISIGGIDDSQYADIAAGNSVSFYDPTFSQRNFYVGLSAVGDEVCVTDKSKSNNEISLGCVPRPIPMNPPTVSACTSTNTCMYNSNANPATEPRISVSVGNPPKTAILGVDTTLVDPNSTSTPQNNLAPTAFCAKDDLTSGGNSSSNKAPCYIYGAQFSSYITDSNNTTTASSANGTITPSLVNGYYTGGIQYVQGSYCRGATKICLTGYSNPEQQVVAKMIAITDSSSGTTQYKVSNLISDRVIPPRNATLPLSSASLFNPDTGYITSSTQPTYVAYGFLNSGQYFENSTCNSNGNSCVATSTTYPSATSCKCTNGGVASPCNITGCEWAFLQNNPNSTVTYIGYTDGVNQYMMNDANGNPQYGLRPLNPLEQGLCADMPQPQCGAISNPEASDGYASWPASSAGQTATGTCLAGTTQSNGTNPTRQCLYPDNGTLPNGCPAPSNPTYTSVTNPCQYQVPTWWPSEFLYGQSNFQGAIVNQFNVAPDYMRSFVPNRNNNNQLYLSGSTINYYSPERWVTTSYNSCKDYRTNIDVSKTPRTNTDADQEMLFISRDNWRNIWRRDWNGDGYSNDLTWLLDNSTDNNGCYVYNVNNYVSATTSGIVVGLKICKYQNKISFALVDLSNGVTDYTNTNYLMQSNLIYYDMRASANNGWDNNLNSKTIVTNNVSSGNSNYVNNGFVIDINGFNYSVSNQLRLARVPTGFVRVETPESVDVLYAASVIYNFTTSYKNNLGQTRHRDYHYYTNFPNGGSITGGESFSSPTPQRLNSCALSVYRRAVNYSGSVTSTSYFSIPTTPISAYSRGTKTYPNYPGPFISSLYVYTSYNGDNSESDWPYANNCQMQVKLQNFVRGNSAINPSMFLWSSPTMYNVCNQS